MMTEKDKKQLLEGLELVEDSFLDDLADALFSIGKALIFLFELTYGSKLSRYLLENIFQADNSY